MKYLASFPALSIWRSTCNPIARQRLPEDSGGPPLLKPGVSCTDIYCKNNDSTAKRFVSVLYLCEDVVHLTSIKFFNNNEVALK